MITSTGASAGPLDAEKLRRGVPGDDATACDEHTRRAGAQSKIDLQLSGRVDVREQPAVSRATQHTPRQQAGVDGRRPSEGSVQVGSRLTGVP
jgi:hypothetical protein